MSIHQYLTLIIWTVVKALNELNNMLYTSYFFTGARDIDSIYLFFFDFEQSLIIGLRDRVNDTLEVNEGAVIPFLVFPVIAFILIIFFLTKKMSS
jgi:hypothetical protein